jgi:two-component system chemotaxis response regulator CheY
MRAIVIDDSRAMRLIIKRILTGLGFECLEAGDGREGIERLKANLPAPAIALVDWNMPNMNGLEFIKAIRTDAAFKEMQILMVTTEVEMERVAAALEAGANEYVMKPFTAEALAEKVGMLQLTGAKAA